MKARHGIAAASAGLLAGLVLLEVGLRLGGAWIYRAQRDAPGPARDPGEFVAITLGESTTQGSGGLSRGVNYPDILERLLRERCPRTKVRVENLGLAGTNSAIIAEELPAQLAKIHPDLVVTMIGINDPAFLAAEESRMAAIVRPSNFRVVRLFRWLRDALGAKDKRDHAEKGAEAFDEREALRKAETGELADDRSFALAFSQPLENLADAEKSRVLHERVLRARPDHAWAMLELGKLARRAGRVRRAIELHEKALASSKVPDERDWFRYQLALDHAENGDWPAVAAIRGKVAMAPGNALMFGDLYLAYEKAEEAVRFLEEVRVHLPRETRIIGMLELARRAASGGAEPARESGSEAIFEELPETKRSYDTILGRSLAAGAEVLVMQYPTRPLAPLARMLGNLPKGAWLLSNEKPFLGAVREQGYDKVFYDYFGGSFGHMTELGNTLLATNAANLLLSEPTSLKARCR